MDWTAEILRAIAHELREYPERWTQGGMARKATGEFTPWFYPDATCWCLIGHVFRATSIQEQRDLIFNKLSRALTKSGRKLTATYKFNDARDTTLPDVIFILELAATL